MLHVARQIQRRFPGHGTPIASMLLPLSALGALIGLALLANH